MNADLIAKDLKSLNPENASYDAVTLASEIRENLISQGGHSVPIEKIHSRIPRSMQHIKTALSIVDEARILDNSSTGDPFKQIIVMRSGNYEATTDPLPD